MDGFGVNRPVARTEDQRLLTGGGRYIDDVNLPKQAYGYLLRSPHAHARIVKIDTTAAKKAPGVLDIVTGADWVAAGFGNMPYIANPMPGFDPKAMVQAVHRPLAMDKARHVGDGIAYIVAETRAQAKDAAELIEVDYAPLPSVTDTGQAPAAGAPVIWDDAGTNVAYVFHQGDQVEIISTKEQAPSPLWEQFVVTGRARAEIRRYLRHAQRGEHVKMGQKILEKTFAEQGTELSEKAIGEVAKKLRLSKAEDVYADVGRGVLRGHEVLAAVFPELKRSEKSRIKSGGPADQAAKPISIRGLTEGIAYNLAPCCHPLPGDRIVGLMTPGEGVNVHTIDCAELDKAQNMDDWLDVSWGHNAAESGPSVGRVAVRVKNEPGSLAAVMTVIATNGGNIFNMKVTGRNPLFFEFMMDIEVRDVGHLQNIVGALRVNNAVKSVDRVREADASKSHEGPLS